MRGPIVEEIVDRDSNGDIGAIRLLEAHPNATIFLEYTVYNAHNSDGAIQSIDARHARNGREIRLTAPRYIDCSGKCILGLLCGAETLFGREGQTQYGERLAPRRADNMHHGNTVFFRTGMTDSPVRISMGKRFSSVWASDLSL